jgi:diketogulonate reductase-like aldo/keto reductase
MASLSLASTIPLIHSSESIPVLGYGVYRIPDKECPQACELALAKGYRLIDTAQLYCNEQGVGRGMRGSDVPRGDVFVTTKIRYPRLGKGKTYLRAWESVLKIAGRSKAEEEKAGDDDKAYVDLFLLHTPYGIKKGDRKEMWLALEKLHAEGRARAIGVSNFEIEHLEEMKQYATIWPPSVNQLQVGGFLLPPHLTLSNRSHAIPEVLAYNSLNNPY